MRDPDLQLIATDDADATELESALAAVTPPARTDKSDAFNDGVRRALGRDAARRSAFRRRFIGLSALVAAAAVLLAFVLPSLLGPRAAYATWEDVVKAVGRVDAMHVVFYLEDPDDMDDQGAGVGRHDTYYRRPGLWRGNGWGYVHFRGPKGDRMYKVGSREFVEPSSVWLKPLNERNLHQFEQSGSVLRLVLDNIFHDGAPAPVRVALGVYELESDLELFEYRKPTEPDSLARIWVGKSSRLPIRIDLLKPSDGSLISCHFEYGDPLPESAFDADQFAATVERDKLTRPAPIFRAGLATTRPGK